jgi:hypothetical protein
MVSRDIYFTRRIKNLFIKSSSRRHTGDIEYNQFACQNHLNSCEIITLTLLALRYIYLQFYEILPIT